MAKDLFAAAGGSGDKRPPNVTIEIDARYATRYASATFGLWLRGLPDDLLALFAARYAEVDKDRAVGANLIAEERKRRAAAAAPAPAPKPGS